MQQWILVWLVSGSLWAGEIALTFDDAPRKDTAHFTGAQRAQLLLEALERAGVERVAFFANTVKFDSDEALARMEMYAAAGHVIGNHTHSHQWIHKIGPEAYIKDLQTAHEQLKNHPGFVPWFRYPFLDQGWRRADQLDVARALSDLGYFHGYVTVDNYDWYMDALLQRALAANQQVDMEILKQVYIETLWACIQFYAQLAIDALGRSPRHVLLLHENDLAAMFVDDLVFFLKEQGWKIITPQEAYADPIATTYPMGRCRNGRVACLARSNNFEGQRWHPSEDEAYLDKLFAQRKVFH